MSDHEPGDVIEMDWVFALPHQLRGDVIRGEATQAQFDQFMAPRWIEAPENVSEIADTFKQWRKFIEGGQTYGS